MSDDKQDEVAIPFGHLEHACIQLDWIMVELRIGSRHGRYPGRRAGVFVQCLGQALHPLWLLPDGVGIGTVVEFIRERCPTFVRCNSPELFRAIGHHAIHEFAAAAREWNDRATELRLHQLAAKGWRLVHAKATIGVVCLVSPDDPQDSAGIALSASVIDSGVDLTPDTIEDVLSGCGLDHDGYIYGDHGLEVSAGEALAVFCAKHEAMEGRDDDERGSTGEA